MKTEPNYTAHDLANAVRLAERLNATFGKMRHLCIIVLVLLASCQSDRGVPHPNWAADCGPIPRVDIAELVAAAKKEWWWGTRLAESKDVVTLGPARAVWTVSDGPHEYGYATFFVFVPKGKKEYDMNQIPCIAFYQDGGLVRVGRLVDRNMRLTFLDDDPKRPNQSPLPTRPAGG